LLIACRALNRCGQLKSDQYRQTKFDPSLNPKLKLKLKSNRNHWNSELPDLALQLTYYSGNIIDVKT
jgi:hypothetical protein